MSKDGSSAARMTFRGRILPERDGLTLEYAPTYVRTEVEGDPSIRYSVKVADAELTVAVDHPAYTDGAHSQLAHIVFDLARTTVEIATLALGVAYHVIIDDVDLPDGRTVPIILADRKLAARMSSLDALDLEAATDLAVKDGRIARVVSDAVVMLSWLHYAPIAAGRVAEGLLRLLTGGRSADHWRQMHDILRVDRDYVQFLTEHATPARHGDRQYVPADVNAELAARAWTLLDRFFAFRLGGDQPLDPQKYPILSG